MSSAALEAICHEYTGQSTFHSTYSRGSETPTDTALRIVRNVSTVDFNQGLPSPQYVGCEHLQQYLNPSSLSMSVHHACKALETHDFDAVAFRGMSGALLAPAIAMRMHKKMLLVRKEWDRNHTCHTVEGDRSARRYIIIDDFICSGDTFNEIYDAVAKFAPEAECLGLLEVTHIEPHKIRQCVESGEQYPLGTPYGFKPRTISED